MTARLAERAHHGVARAFAGHLDQAQFRDLQNRRARPILLQSLFQGLVHAALVLFLLHVDQVENDDAAAVPQPELIGDFLNGFEVRLQDRVFEVFLSDVATRVHVDRDESFRLVDHDVAARLQPNFALQGARQFS